MKKMIPVYVLQVALVATVIAGVYRLTQHLALIERELTGMRSEQVKQPQPGTRPTRGGVLQVEVVNSVEIDGDVDCRISEPLDVNISNTPVEVEIVR